MRWIIGLTAILTCAACGWAFASGSGADAEGGLVEYARRYLMPTLVASAGATCSYTHNRDKEHPEWAGENAKGIAGWLLYFIVVSCLYALFAVLVTVTGGLRAIEEYQMVKTTYYTYILIFVSTVFFLFFCIYRLVSYHKDAIKLIKISLVLNLVWVLIAPIILIVVMGITIDPAIMGKTAVIVLYLQHGFDIILGVVFFLVWFNYFSFKKSQEYMV